MLSFPSIVIGIRTETPTGAASAGDSTEDGLSTPMHALIIGTATPHHELIKETFRGEGFGVFHAETQEDAWAVYGDRAPQVVVLPDVEAPSLDFVRRIRAQNHGEAVILLALVQPEVEMYGQGLFDAQIDDCILESISPSYLKARLVLAVRRSHRRQQRYQIEAELAARVRQQAAVAELGRHALAGMPVQALMDRAVAITADALNVELCKVLEQETEGGELVLKAGVGWRDGVAAIGYVEGAVWGEVDAGEAGIGGFG